MLPVPPRHPLARDAYELDAEWQRRFPAMVGTLACERCAVGTYWRCQEPDAAAYSAGHIPAATGGCFDAWSHVGRHGTQRAMILVCPQSALLQGGEPYLRDLTTRRGVKPAVAASVATLLHEWDTTRGNPRMAGWPTP